MITVDIGRRKLSVDRAFRAIVRDDCGGVAIFAGTVRSPNEDRAVLKISYTGFTAMIKTELAKIAREAAKKWPRGCTYLAHRLGTLKPGEPSVIVAVSRPHRAEAFDACRYLIEQLKKRAPIWKEEFHRGGRRWVANKC